MNKIFLMIFLTILFSACSTLTKRTDLNTNCSILETYYKNWDLDKAYELCLEEQNKNPQKFYNDFIEKIKLRKFQKDEIYAILETLVETKNVKFLEKYVDRTFLNMLKFNEFKSYDLSKFEIFYDTPIFYDDTAKVNIALTLLDDTFYFEVVLKLKNNEWKIIDFKERV